MLITLFHWWIKLTGGLAWALIVRWHIDYEDRSVQGRRIKGAAIVVPNHTNVMDVAAMLFLFPFRTLRCVVAELMYEKNVFMTLMLHGMGTVKVDRNSHDFDFLGKCKRILDRGGVVEIYPESRIPKAGEKTPLEFKPSAIYLALESGAPIIPVYTSGGYFSGGRSRVVIGKPIDARALYDNTLGEQENIAAITAHVRGKIIELRDQFCKEA